MGLQLDQLTHKLARSPIWIRLPTFLGLLVLIWLPIAAPIYTFIPDPDWVAIFSMAILYAEFIGLARFWGKQVYIEAHVLRRYGWGWSRSHRWELSQGLALGLGIIALLFGIETLCGWVEWSITASVVQPLTTSRLTAFVLEGGAIGLAVASAEELFFRGWLWDEIHRDLRSRSAQRATAIGFACLHYIRPLNVILSTLPQFFGLLLLGLLLGQLKQRSNGRLGSAIGLHGGLVWGYYLVNVGQWLRYTDRVPTWVTGLGGNPLAGVLGLTVLGLVSIGLTKLPKRT